MGRSIPKSVCIDGVDPGAGRSQKEQVYQIELITPMYGGGVETGGPPEGLGLEPVGSPATPALPSF